MGVIIMCGSWEWSCITSNLSSGRWFSERTRGRNEDDTSSVDVVQAWNTRDISAQMELILHCEALGRSTWWVPVHFKEIWEFFNNSYEHTDLVYQVSLMIKRLVNNTMHEGQSATKFLDGWKVLLDEVLIFKDGNLREVSAHAFVGSSSHYLEGFYYYSGNIPNSITKLGG